MGLWLGSAAVPCMSNALVSVPGLTTGEQNATDLEDMISDLVAAVSLGKVVSTLDSAGGTRSLQTFSLSYLPTIPTDGTSLFFQLWTRPCTASLLREFQLIHAAFGIESSPSLLKNPLISCLQDSQHKPSCHPAVLSR